jgi:tetratricopeptide (TPR) repeat protein
MAKKAYQTALALNPNDYNTHYNLGELSYTKYEDDTAALTEFKKNLEGNPAHAEANLPKNVRVLLQLGVAYERLDMKDEALSIYRLILDIDAVNQVARQKIKLLSSG